MEEPAHRFVRHGGVQLHVETRGEGQRHVVFAHGWISSRRMWYDVAALLDPRAHRLHLMDFRGCGLSDRPLEAHGFEAYAGDLRAVVESVEAPVTLVGHSMGGRLAQFLAVDPPPNLRHLILVAPGSARPVTLTAKRSAMAADAFGSRERIARFQQAAMKRHLDAQTFERIVNDALLCQYEHWASVEERARFDFADRLAGVRLPALVIAGANDPLAPPSRVKREVAAPLAGSLFVVLKDAGHNLPVEAPGEIAAAVERFG